MKTTYAQNNTTSLFLIVASLVLALVLVAALLGLSEKPDVTTVAYTTSGDHAATGTTGSSSYSAEGASDETDMVRATNLQAIPDDDAALDDSQSQASSGTSAATPEPTAAPTATPAPTEVAELAAAVEPLPTTLTEQTDAAATESNDDAAAPTVAPPVASPTGTLTGAFFTRADEDEGATVVRNEVELRFDDSGGGNYRAVLDITYGDGTQVQIDMGGDFVYAPNRPQVMTTVSGTYRRDAIDDLEDISTERGDLSISSFAAGTGALCTPKCFGFTFPPPVDT